MNRRIVWGAALIAGAALVSGQALPMEPPHEAGASVTGSFEGWYKNADGSFGLLLGYYNRNQKQELDIPIGPNNRIEPGGPDRGQPTHFMPGRGWGVFVVNVPPDFGDGKLTWTLAANGVTTVIPANLKPDWEISPFSEDSAGNTPPTLRFEENGPSVQGPRDFMVERTASVGVPLTLDAWISDDAKWTSNSGAKPRNMPPPVSLHWTKYRGPGKVLFANDRPAVVPLPAATGFAGKATAIVTFSEPGDYILHLLINDYSGEGGSGFVCCWTNGLVKVAVK